MKVGERIQVFRRYMVAEPGGWSWEDEIVEGEIIYFCRNGNPAIKTDSGRRLIINCRCEILKVK